MSEWWWSRTRCRPDSARWIAAWRQGGFDALGPSPRQSSPRTPPEVIELAAALKKENPARTAAQVQRILRAQAGWAPDERTLQRMFIRKSARGKGIGSMLMEQCVADAKAFKFSSMYLETLSNMHEAISLYKKSGFRIIPHPLGKTGHSGCDVSMIMDL